MSQKKAAFGSSQIVYFFSPFSSTFEQSKLLLTPTQHGFNGFPNLITPERFTNLLRYGDHTKEDNILGSQISTFLFGFTGFWSFVLENGQKGVVMIKNDESGWLCLIVNPGDGFMQQIVVKFG